MENRVVKRVAGVALSSIGTVIVTLALEQISDPELPSDLFTRAGAVGGASLVVLGGGFLVALLAVITTTEEKLKMFGMVMKWALAPTGIALSVAASFLISGVAAKLIETVDVEVLVVLGGGMIFGGLRLGRGVWWDITKAVIKALVDAVKGPASVQAPSASSTGPTATSS